MAGVYAGSVSYTHLDVYKRQDLNLLGTLDFLKGAKWFSEQDGIEIHKKLAAYNYEMKSKEDFIGYKGLTEEDLSPYGNCLLYTSKVY